TPAELDGVAAQARELREWFRGFITSRKGRTLGVEDMRELEPLNRLLAGDERFDQIGVETERGRTALGLRTLRRWHSPESLLLPIGQETVTFLCSEDLRDVKACESPTCTLMFVDRTHGRGRRWCSMAICGNRAKQAAHRGRRNSGP